MITNQVGNICSISVLGFHWKSFDIKMLTSLLSDRDVIAFKYLFMNVFRYMTDQERKNNVSHLVLSFNSFDKFNVRIFWRRCKFILHIKS
jgi:hypothetical protein